MIAHPDKVESLFPGGYHQEQHVRRVETTAAPIQHPQQLHEGTSVPKPLPRGSQLQQQSALQLQQPPQPVAGRREHEGEGESSANVYQTPPVFVGVAAGKKLIAITLNISTDRPDIANMFVATLCICPSTSLHNLYFLF